MTTIFLICACCKNNVQRYIPEKGYDDKYICDAYPKGIPEYVAMGTKDCPKLKKTEPFDWRDD
jgi:hypothetical protein